MNIINIIVICCITYFIIEFIYNEVKYHKFCQDLHIGTVLINSIKFLDDDFDEPTTFYIAIINMTDSQVLVKYRDGSKTTMYKRSLFNDNWKILNY